jgi:hypothetical protein
VGVLPLLSAASDRRATLGTAFAVLSLTLYYESRPFKRESTNVLAVVAQYATLMTFGTAQVIEVGVARGVSDFVLGFFLVAVNTAIVALIGYANAARYRRARSEKGRARERSAQRLEWAVGFGKNKFATTLSAMEKDHLPSTHAAVYWYGSLEDAKQCLRSGLYATRVPAALGIVFTLHRPQELDSDDRDAFPLREAVLVCSVPWALLEFLGEEKSRALCVLPTGVLTALRGSYFGDLLEPRPWFQGQVLLPPKQIVRAYQLAEVPDGPTAQLTPAAPMALDQPFANGLRSEAGVPRRLLLRSSTLRGLLPWTSRRGSAGRPSLEQHPGIFCPLTCLQFTDRMAVMRAICKRKDWELVYHYTSQKLGPLILNMGLRMSTQGQGDGGVYFSTLGPASYELGTEDYEANIIVDCEWRLPQHRFSCRRSCSSRSYFCSLSHGRLRRGTT